MHFMSEPRPVARLNDILGLLAVVTPAEVQRGSRARTFELNSGSPLCLDQQKVREFDSAIQDVLRSIPGAEETLSEQRLLDELMPLIQRKKIEGSRFSRGDFDSYRESLSAIPIKTYRVLRPIYGVTLPQNGPPLQFGHFTIYDSHLHQAQLARGTANFKFPPWASKLSGLLIECAVVARDMAKAEQLADAQFHRFELITRFFIGRRGDDIEVGVLNYVGPQMRKMVIFAENEFSEGSAWKGALQQVPMADAFFCDPPPPFAKLLQIFKSQRSELERHVVRCAEWTAQAMCDPSASSAFVKAAIALEVLFSQNEKAVITPSIMAQIAEGCAFLLADSADSAIKIEREVRRLYGVRSAIVHSGKDSVSRFDLNTFIQICRNAVLALLNSGELESVGTMSKLTEHFKKRKYSGI
jgi:hypothetical protein